MDRALIVPDSQKRDGDGKVERNVWCDNDERFSRSSKQISLIFISIAFHSLLLLL